MPTENEMRAENALGAVEHYRSLVNNEPDVEMDIQDLLTDLMHLCKEEKIDFSRCLARAQDHFKEETEDANDK